MQECKKVWNIGKEKKSLNKRSKKGRLKWQKKKQY